MDHHTPRWAAGAAAAAALILCASPAAADGLSGRCDAVNDSGGDSCLIQKDGRDWLLHTAVLVGGGGKGRVELLEQTFCQTAIRNGASGHVVRENRIPAQPANSKGATMQWTCAPAAVSAAPPRRR